MRFSTAFALLAAAAVPALASPAKRQTFLPPALNSPGSIAAPANGTRAEAGDTIYLREGTYAPDTNIQVGKSGTSSAPITVKPYEGEKVIVDGENMPG